MKLIFENWRQYLKEQEELQKKHGLGIVVDFKKDEVIKISLIDLDKILEQIDRSGSIKSFLEKISNREMYDQSVVGYIEAKYSKESSIPVGDCHDAYTVENSIGEGYGRILYNALLGFAAANDIHVTSDRLSVSDKAKRRWSKVDAQTDEEIPSKTAPYIGFFDNIDDPQTEPTEDDCKTHPEDYLNKGYKDSSKIQDYEELETKLDTFFDDVIAKKFDDPSFFAKLFGKTPKNKAQKLKKQLLLLGKYKFYDYLSPAFRNRKPTDQFTVTRNPINT